jgi:hypothetical protein
MTDALPAVTFGHPQFYGLDRVIKTRGRINCIVINLLISGKLDFDGAILKPGGCTNLELWTFIYSLWKFNRDSPNTIWKQMCVSRESVSASPKRFVAAIKYVNRLCTGRRGASTGKLNSDDLVAFIEFVLRGHNALVKAADGPKLDGDVHLGYLGTMLDVLERRVVKREQLLQHKLENIQAMPPGATYRTMQKSPLIKTFANGQEVKDGDETSKLVNIHLVTDS